MAGLRGGGAAALRGAEELEEEAEVQPLLRPPPPTRQVPSLSRNKQTIAIKAPIGIYTLNVGVFRIKSKDRYKMTRLRMRFILPAHRAKSWNKVPEQANRRNQIAAATEAKLPLPLSRGRLVDHSGTHSAIELFVCLVIARANIQAFHGQVCSVPH